MLIACTSISCLVGCGNYDQKTNASNHSQLNSLVQSAEKESTSGNDIANKVNKEPQLYERLSAWDTLSGVPSVQIEDILIYAGMKYSDLVAAINSSATSFTADYKDTSEVAPSGGKTIEYRRDDTLWFSVVLQNFSEYPSTCAELPIVGFSFHPQALNYCRFVDGNYTKETICTLATSNQSQLESELNTFNYDHSLIENTFAKFAKVENCLWCNYYLMTYDRFTIQVDSSNTISKFDYEMKLSGSDPYLNPKPEKISEITNMDVLTENMIKELEDTYSLTATEKVGFIYWRNHSNLKEYDYLTIIFKNDTGKYIHGSYIVLGTSYAGNLLMHSKANVSHNEYDSVEDIYNALGVSDGILYDTDIQ